MTRIRDVVASHRDRRFALATIVLAGLGSIAVAESLTHAAAAMPYVALALPVAVLAVFGRRRLQAPFLSPVWILVLVFSGIGALGYAFHGDLTSEGGGSIALDMTDKLATRTAYLFALLSGSIAGGALAVAMWWAPRSGPAPRPSAPSQTLRDASLLASAAVLLVGIVGGGGAILQRAGHLGDIETGSLAALTGTVGVGLVAICGYLFGSESGGRKFFAFVVAAGFFVLFFAGSSRRLAVFPLIFAVGYYAATRRRRPLVLGLVASVLLLPLPLYLRDLPQHGLLPYLASLGGFSYGDVDWLAGVNNILISFPITAHSAFVRSALSPDWLWVALNPLPGSMAGWYEIAPVLRLNIYTPFSTVGELGNYGPAVVVAVGAVLGALLAYLDGRVGHYLRTGYEFVAVGIVGMSGLMAVTALQYNARSFFRLLLYALVLELAVRVVRRRSEDGDLGLAVDVDQCPVATQRRGVAADRDAGRSRI